MTFKYFAQALVCAQWTKRLSHFFVLKSCSSDVIRSSAWTSYGKSSVLDAWLMLWVGSHWLLSSEMVQSLLKRHSLTGFFSSSTDLSDIWHHVFCISFYEPACAHLLPFILNFHPAAFSGCLCIQAFLCLQKTCPSCLNGYGVMSFWGGCCGMIDSVKHSAVLSQCHSHCLLIHEERNCPIKVSSTVFPGHKCTCLFCVDVLAMAAGAHATPWGPARSECFFSLWHIRYLPQPLSKIKCVFTQRTSCIIGCH